MQHQASEDRAAAVYHADLAVSIQSHIDAHPELLRELRADFARAPARFDGSKSASASLEVPVPVVGACNFGYHHPYLACSYERALCERHGLEGVSVFTAPAVADGAPARFRVTLHLHQARDEALAARAVRDRSEAMTGREFARLVCDEGRMYTHQLWNDDLKQSAPELFARMLAAWKTAEDDEAFVQTLRAQLSDAEWLTVFSAQYQGAREGLFFSGPLTSVSGERLDWRVLTRGARMATSARPPPPVVASVVATPRKLLPSERRAQGCATSGAGSDASPRLAVTTR